MADNIAQAAVTDVTARAVRKPVGGREYVIVKIETDAGVSGVGEMAAEPDPATVVARVLRHKPAPVGQDALEVSPEAGATRNKARAPSGEREASAAGYLGCVGTSIGSFLSP